MSKSSIMDEALQTVNPTMPPVPAEMDREPPGSSHKRPTPNSEFLCLPPELRLCIYEYVFADTHLLVRKGTHPASTPRESFSHLVLLRGSPQLLFVCRATFQEGLPIFWSEALLHAGLRHTFLLEEPDLAVRINPDTDIRPAASFEVIWAIPERSKPLVRHLRNLLEARGPDWKASRKLDSSLEEHLRELPGLRTCEFHIWGFNWYVGGLACPVWENPILSDSKFNRLSPETCRELVWPEKRLSSLRRYLVSRGLSSEVMQRCTFFVRFGVSPEQRPAKYLKFVFINLNTEKIIVQRETVSKPWLKRSEIEENYKKLLGTR